VHHIRIEPLVYFCAQIQYFYAMFQSFLIICIHKTSENLNVSHIGLCVSHIVYLSNSELPFLSLHNPTSRETIDKSQINNIQRIVLQTTKHMARRDFRVHRQFRIKYTQRVAPFCNCIVPVLYTNSRKDHFVGKLVGTLP